MEITQTATGFSIKFPFALKDAFRLAFPSAKWNPAQKTWNVGPRSGKRLEAWVAETQQAAEELNLLEEKELTEKEYAELRKEVERVRSDTQKAIKRLEVEQASRESFAELRAQLVADKAKFDALAKQITEAIEETKAKRDEAFEILDSVLDLHAINAARREMACWHKQVGSTAHSKFDEAQAVIIAELRKLESVGYTSRGLRWLAYANFNRPDRDHADLMPAGAMYDISKIDK